MQVEAVEFGDPGLVGCGFRLWRDSSQAEHLAALLGTNGDPVDDRVAVDVLQGICRGSSSSPSRVR